MKHVFRLTYALPEFCGRNYEQPDRLSLEKLFFHTILTNNPSNNSCSLQVTSRELPVAEALQLHDDA